MDMLFKLRNFIVLYFPSLKSHIFKYILRQPPLHCRCWSGAHFPTVVCKGVDQIKSLLLIFYVYFFLKKSKICSKPLDPVRAC